MSPELNTIDKAFRHYFGSYKQSGRVGEILQLVCEQGVRSTALRALIPRREDDEYHAMQSELLDLLLFCIEYCLEDHYITPDESTDLSYLKIAFRIQEEDFYAHKYAQMEKVLSAQVARIISDENVDRTEALQQVELQRCFGISYDQFLKITRPHVDGIVNRWLDLIASDNVINPNERSMFIQQILLLNTVYFLSPEQRRILDDLSGNITDETLQE